MSGAVGETRTREGVLGALREVIAAIDRRLPQRHRPSESKVAWEAALLRREASDRARAVEREVARGRTESAQSSSPADHLP